MATKAREDQMAKKGRTTKRHLRDAEVTRRQALARLGLGVSIAYAAPVLLSLSKAAASSGGSDGSGGSGSGGSGPGGSGSGGSGSGGSGSGGSGSGGSGSGGSGPGGSGGGSGPAKNEESRGHCDEEYLSPWCPVE